MQIACENGRFDIIQLLVANPSMDLEKGVGILFVCIFHFLTSGQNPLEAACNSGSPQTEEIVNFLICSGANPGKIPAVSDPFILLVCFDLTICRTGIHGQVRNPQSIQKDKECSQLIY